MSWYLSYQNTEVLIIDEISICGARKAESLFASMDTLGDPRMSADVAVVAVVAVVGTETMLASTSELEWDLQS